MKKGNPMSRLNSVSKGLSILDKYPNTDIACEHDILFAGPGDSKNVTGEDRVELESLGWFVSDEYDSWAIWI